MLRYLGGGYFIGVPARDLSPVDVAALPPEWTAARLVATGRYAWTTSAVAGPPPPAALPWPFRRKP